MNKIQKVLIVEAQENLITNPVYAKELLNEVLSESLKTLLKYEQEVMNDTDKKRLKEFSEILSKVIKIDGIKEIEQITIYPVSDKAKKSTIYIWMYNPHETEFKKIAKSNSSWISTSLEPATKEMKSRSMLNLDLGNVGVHSLEEVIKKFKLDKITNYEYI